MKSAKECGEFIDGLAANIKEPDWSQFYITNVATDVRPLDTMMLEIAFDIHTFDLTNKHRNEAKDIEAQERAERAYDRFELQYDTETGIPKHGEI